MDANTDKRAAGTRLFMVAALSLFVELALIRWMGANVIYLGYFSNFVLLACFLGLGVGFLLTDRRYNLIDWAPVILALLMGLTLASRLEVSLPDSGDVVYFGIDPMSETSKLPLPVILSVIFLGTVSLFAAFGQAIGRCFAPFDPIPAYTIDIVGSLTGIVAFTVLSLVSTPSHLWFGIAGIAFVALQFKESPRARRLAILGAVGMTMLAWASHRDPRAIEARWSPYQFLKVHEGTQNTFNISANRVPHQFMVPVELQEPMYLEPYRIAREAGVDPKSALVIGSGSGSDIAYALSVGLERVHAVEIDPVIAAIGREYNPDKPYSDPAVKLSVTDGRRVLQHDDETYDLVIFALPDSLALLSSQASVRLESFLFTKEALEHARSRLNPDGVLILYNFYRNPFVVERIARTLEEIWGYRPLLVSEPESNLTLIAIGDTLDVGSKPVVEDAGPIPTDDWPFLYLKDRSIPTIYIGLVLGIWLITLLLVVRVSPRKTWRAGQWPFFMMGAAFLLLETKSIVQFSLLFGATWLVNSLVFAGVLLAVLGANAIVYFLKPKRFWPWYLGLAISLAAGYFVPISELTALSSDALRYTSAIVLLFSPIFFANMIFSRTFSDTEEADHSFGWNILGMMFGGTIEYASMVTGYQNMAIVVALFYGLALFTTIRAIRSEDQSL